MNGFLKSLNINRNSAVLAVLLSIFIVFNIQVPHTLANLIDTLLGRIVVIAGALSLLFAHPVVGVLGIIAAYELVRRSENTTGTGPAKRFLPSETRKSQELSALNQFPVTIEEQVIANMLPQTSHTALPPSSFKPVLDPLHEAAKISA